MDRLLSERARRIVILALLLAPLVTLHVRFAPRRGPFGNDPSYYMQAARFVAEQNRLLTNVSLYHDALVPLPQPYRIYPLWPVVLGWTAKAIGLVAAANILPQLFFVIDLLLLYALARRSGADDAAAYLTVLVAGSNFIYFESTIFPYTEGLAIACGLASLLLMETLPISAGVLGGLAFLARYQMVALPVAVMLVLLVRARRALWRYAIGAAVVALPWLLYARSLEHRADVPRFDEWIHAPLVSQLVRGIVVALNPFNRASLFHAYGLLVLLVPLSFIAWRKMNCGMMLTGLIGAGMLTRFESVRFDHWLFGERHVLLFVFAIVAGFVALMQSRLRNVAIVIAAIAIAQGMYAAFTYPLPAGEGLMDGERQLVERLPPNAVVLTTNAQILSVYSRAAFHWTDCDLEAGPLLGKLPIDRVIVYDREKRCRFANGLTDVEAAFDGVTLYRVTRKMASTGAPSTLQTATGLR